MLKINVVHIVEGVEFFLDGAMTNGPVSVTEIGIADQGTPLICQSEAAVSGGARDWYLNPDQESTAVSDRIGNTDTSGWIRTRSDDLQQVLLRRVSASVTALEGVFTCQISLDSNPIRSLSVLHPSELPTRPL